MGITSSTEQKPGANNNNQGSISDQQQLRYIQQQLQQHQQRNSQQQQQQQQQSQQQRVPTSTTPTKTPTPTQNVQQQQQQYQQRQSMKQPVQYGQQQPQHQQYKQQYGQQPPRYIPGSTPASEFSVLMSPPSSPMAGPLGINQPIVDSVPTVFTWAGGGKEVFVSGSFNNWKEKIPLSHSEKDFTLIYNLPPGVHQYKFIVDGKWMHSTEQPVAADVKGNLLNFVEVKTKDFSTELSSLKLSTTPPGSYSKTIPPEEEFQKIPPPSLPPHLRRALLNTQPSTEDPTLLPLPHHVMLNHLYSLPRKDKVTILGVTHRYKTKFVTTVLYKPFPVCQGLVFKLGKHLYRWKPRWFIIDHNCTLFYFDTKDRKPIGSPIGFFNLMDCVFELVQHDKRSFCFKITELSTKRNYLLSTDTSEEFELWFNLLSQVRETSKKKVQLICKLQSHVRKRIQMQNYKKLKESALVIQRAFHFFEEQRKFALFVSRVIKVQSLVRRFIQKTRFKKLKQDTLIIQGHFHTIKAKNRLEKEFNRVRIVQELLSTEKSYVYNLKLIIDIFIRPLINFNAIDQKVLSPSEISGIFGNWERLFAINSNLLLLIQNKIDNWHIDQLIGDIFLSNTDELLEYTPYVTNFDYSRKLLEKLTQTNVNLRHFLDAAQRDKRSKYLDISSFLIQPIQRLPRYELLLRDILKQTSLNHPDYEFLQKGVSKIREITMYINDQQKERENLSQIIQIQQQLVNTKNEKISFSSASRLIKQGEVKIYKKKWNFMYLFNSQILLVQKKNDDEQIVKEVILLDTVSIRDESESSNGSGSENTSNSDLMSLSFNNNTPSSPNLSSSSSSTVTNNSNNNSKSLINNRFKLLSTTGNNTKEFIFYWDNPTDKDSWLTDITITLNRLDTLKKYNI
eukprot:gene1136-1442_t